MSSGSEPTDAVRVVNALLTQIDKLKELSNVLVITTSNLSSNIDEAFIDRADIKAYVGLPSSKVREKILASTFFELERTGLVLFPKTADEIDTFKKEFQNIIQKTENTSCRSLRKLPFLACAANPNLEKSWKVFMTSLDKTIH